ncbi:MAG: hypothetical protein E4H41_07235 [Gemmatimonadales bacterium]|jgi:hypothetical protein|nr:MAG: hypothetical protein E4H41_07235 [Gemmatimonadales bacterium]
MFSSDDPASRVTVVDIEMPFGSMVGFMVKWTIASIPAIIILFLIGVVIAVIMGGLLASLGIAPR